MDMGSSAQLISPTYHNTQLTSYDFQSRMENGHWTISMITVTNAQLTSYNCQSNKNKHEVISMVTVTNMAQYTTYLLCLPKQDNE